MFLAECPICHASNIDDKPYCGDCGTSLKIRNFMSICPNCRGANSRNTRFCCDCGSSLAIDATFIPVLKELTISSAVFAEDFVIERRILKEYRGSDVELVIPEGVTTIGEKAFSDFYALKSIVIPEGVEIIKAHAFMRCENLTELTLPDSLIEIGSQAFIGCSNLQKISLGKNLKRCENSAFFNCNALNDIQFRGDVSEWCDLAQGAIYSLMYECKPKTLRMSDGEPITDVSVESIGGSVPAFAFAGTGVKTARLNVRFVGDKVFAKCKDLRFAVLTDSVEYLGERIFSQCTSLEELTIPFVTSKKNDCSLAHLGRLFDYSETIMYSTEAAKAYPNCELLLCSKNYFIKDSNGYEDMTFLIPVGLKRVNISHTNGPVFMNCQNIESVIITGGTYIPVSCFMNCSGLTTVTLPNSLYEISGYAFRDCTNLEAIDLPDGLTTLDYSCFENCSKLKYIVLPDSVKKVSRDAFDNCTSLCALLYSKYCPELNNNVKKHRVNKDQNFIYYLAGNFRYGTTDNWSYSSSSMALSYRYDSFALVEVIRAPLQAGDKLKVGKTDFHTTTYIGFWSPTTANFTNTDEMITIRTNGFYYIYVDTNGHAYIKKTQ